MPHGRTVFPSKGYCIYCGRSGVRLTDEHIVPLSLGGQHIIDDASCDKCADITKKFEQDVARKMWGDARCSYDAPSRRKKDRKSHLTLNDPATGAPNLTVSFAEYPGGFLFYKMHPAGLLQGLPEDFDVSRQWELVVVADNKRLTEFERAYPGRLTAKFWHMPHSFSRMLAKISYCQALTSLDAGDFRPICLPYILGSKSNYSYVVGGQFDLPQPQPQIGYSLNTFSFGTVDHIMVVVEIRLYANANTPLYHVVVGDVVGREKVECALAKLGCAENLLIPQIGGAITTKEQHHWMPEVWPLPFWSAISRPFEL